MYYTFIIELCTIIKFIPDRKELRFWSSFGKNLISHLKMNIADDWKIVPQTSF